MRVLTLLVISALSLLQIRDIAGAEVITMFGQQFEADTFVFCVDRSASTQLGGVSATIEQEINAALAQLSTAEFGLVTYGTSIMEFSSQLSPPTAAAVASAQSWLVQSAVAGSRCVIAATSSSLDLIGANTNDPLIIVILTGNDECGGVPAQLQNPNCTRLAVPLSIVGPTGIPLAQSLSTQDVACSREFRRGDSNDDGQLNTADAVDLLQYLFVSGSTVNPCPDARDADNNGLINLADPLYLLNYLFFSGSPPPAPGPVTCGVDVGSNGLSCHAHSSCP